MRSDQRSSIPTINSTLFMTAFGRDADIPIDMSGAFVSQEAANYITERFEGVYEVCSHFLSAVHYSNPLALDGEEDKPACGVDWALWHNEDEDYESVDGWFIYPKQSVTTDINYRVREPETDNVYNVDNKLYGLFITLSTLSMLACEEWNPCGDVFNTTEDDHNYRASVYDEQRVIIMHFISTTITELEKQDLTNSDTQNIMLIKRLALAYEKSVIA